MDGDEMGREQAHGVAVGFAGQESCRLKEDKEWRFSRPSFGKHLCAAMSRMPSAQKGRAHK